MTQPSQRLLTATLAGLFGLTATAATWTTAARTAGQAPAGIFASSAVAALADKDENDGDQNNGEHHDNGKHKGWYKHGGNNQGENNDNQGENGEHGKHHKHQRGGAGHALVGTLTSINGVMLGVRLGNGRTITVNDSSAQNNGNIANLFVGERVRLRGYYDNTSGVFYANGINAASNDGYGGYPNTNGSCYAGNGTSTVTGYATSGVDGNGNFTLRVPTVPNIPIAFKTYTVHVPGGACIGPNPVGTIGSNVTQAIRVTGYFSSTGNRIQATNISD